MGAPMRRQNRGQPSCSCWRSWMSASNRLIKRLGKQLLQISDTLTQWNCCPDDTVEESGCPNNSTAINKQRGRAFTWAVRGYYSKYIYGRDARSGPHEAFMKCVLIDMQGVKCIQHLLMLRHLHASHLNATQMLFYLCANISLAVLFGIFSFFFSTDQRLLGWPE